MLGVISQVQGWVAVPRTGRTGTPRKSPAWYTSALSTELYARYEPSVRPTRGVKFQSALELSVIESPLKPLESNVYAPTAKRSWKSGAASPAVLASLGSVGSVGTAMVVWRLNRPKRL